MTANLIEETVRWSTGERARFIALDEMRRAFVDGSAPQHYNCRCVMPTEIPPGQRTIDAEYTVGEVESITADHMLKVRL